MSDDSVERIIELETRVAFQEQTLQELNDILTRQAREIDQLRKTTGHLHERFEQLRQEPDDKDADDKPPHY